MEAKELQHVHLLREKQWFARLDVWPFCFIYAAWTVVFLMGYLDQDVLDDIPSSIEEPVVVVENDTMMGQMNATNSTESLMEESHPNPFWIAQLSGLILVCLHVFTHLCTVWSVDIRCLVGYTSVGSVEEATKAKVVPHKFVGNKDVVTIDVKSSDGKEYQRSFTFRKLRFLWDGEQNMFKKLKYPTKKTFTEYRKCSGLTTQHQIDSALERWGPNKFEVPIPAFRELMKEQLLAPFFCFQVFCVALWAIDEYWYYSLLTLFMLVTFESTVVHQRQRNLSQVRALQQPPKPVMVYRCGAWTEISGDALLPGDVVSLTRTKQDGSEGMVIQADMLLLAGTCIVDEAVLTGESTPQWKNSIGEACGDEID